MKPAACLSAILVCILTLLTARPAAGEEIVLRPRYRPGDTYRLSLTVITETEATSTDQAGKSVSESVRLHYQASVLVLEVDDAGRPIRERHQSPSLTFERPGESGSLFKEGVAYEVHRKDAITLVAGERRLDAKLERIVGEVLEKQFEHTLEPALVEPGHPVEAGESWPLDESLTRRFLLSRGMRVLELGDPATATLQHASGAGGSSEWVIDYRIPITRFELTRMPPQAEAARSEARLEGQIRLPSGAPGAADARRAPASTVSRLTLRMSGLSGGVAQRQPWSLRSTISVEGSSMGARDVSVSDATAP